MSDSSAPRWPGSKGGPGLDFSAYRTQAGGAITQPGRTKNKVAAKQKQANKQAADAKPKSPQAAKPASPKPTQPEAPKTAPAKPASPKPANPQAPAQQAKGAAAEKPPAAPKPAAKLSPAQEDRAAKARKEWEATPAKVATAGGAAAAAGAAATGTAAAGQSSAPGAPTVVEIPTKSQEQASASTPRTRRTRKARLRLSRIDPWSVMKTTFLFAIAFGIMLMVVAFVLWSVLAGSGAFESANTMVNRVLGDSENQFDVLTIVSAERVMGFVAVVAAVDVVILTAVATLMAFLYNLAATVMGGLEVTLAED